LSHIASNLQKEYIFPLLPEIQENRGKTGEKVIEKELLKNKDYSIRASTKRSLDTS